MTFEGQIAPYNAWCGCAINLSLSSIGLVVVGWFLVFASAIKFRSSLGFRNLPTPVKAAAMCEIGVGLTLVLQIGILFAGFAAQLLSLSFVIYQLRRMTRRSAEPCFCLSDSSMSSPVRSTIISLVLAAITGVSNIVYISTSHEYDVARLFVPIGTVVGTALVAAVGGLLFVQMAQEFERARADSESSAL